MATATQDVVSRRTASRTPERRLGTQRSRELPSTTAQTYSCPECGHTLRVSGLGRHRVYFEREDAGSASPVLDRVCPACGCGLPGKNGG